jgi:peptidoglycan/xylan/chitin deacetylase (PgdA/CDA1 family)
MTARVLVPALLLAASLVRAETARPLLVTVDDLPLQGPAVDAGERERTHRALLAVLAKHRVRAVGLVVWGRVETDADRRILNAWLDAGHELGSHSFAHPNYTRTSIDAYLADVEKARSGLGDLLAGRGKKLRYFRFPFLNEGNTKEKLDAMRRALATHDIRNLPVTIDTQDWSFAAPWVEAERSGDAAASKRIGQEFQDAMRVSVRHHERHGDTLFGRTTPQVLLLHANAVGAAQWDALFAWLEETGHRFASVDEVLSDPAFSEPPEFVFERGVSLWDRIDHAREWTRAEAEVRNVLATQSAAWSRGDIDAFCAVYAEDASFVSPSGLTSGRAAVLERYRKRYPGAADMGRLTLDVVEVRPSWGPEVSMLGDSVPGSIHSVSVVARWKLVREDKEELSGLTLLVLQRIEGGWRIVQDASM